ncbi:MAG: GNAT family N-acetyltransferase [Oceanibaculum nanhaiense]|uniref:GNAT family N-acetyltransferase n=1 Tax=Oceanibaculum nanhaiense TaxID=1909734 RepID=UPI0025A3376D|nr:GNAT family N-acetyltransferase [Oceanibaculum nanhaiense]MDM7947731.1 GNAT family N-acetyltransferase [Oceanibaculum nanhaiense]
MQSQTLVAYACMTRPVLRAGALSVRAVQKAEIEAIRQWRNAQMEVLRQAEPISPEQQEAYFASHIWPQYAKTQPDTILLSYFDGGTFIGYGGLVHIAWPHRRAEISFLLDPVHTKDDAAYARYFSDFLRLMKRLAFADLGLNRLFTETYPTRPHHIAVLESAGLRREGVMRAHVIIGGQPVDSILHGCLSSDGGWSDED